MYKITSFIQTLQLCFAVLLSGAIVNTSHAQKPEVIRSIKQYEQALRKDSNQRMVELKSITSTIVYDMHYATKNNFTTQQLYNQSNYTYLRLPAARALSKVQSELLQKGLGLKVFDAYRPYSVTQKMWNLIQDERYVANPAKGSGHNRGISIDLTIIDARTGKELDMGTAFDNFTDTAHHNFNHLPKEVLQNRQLLRQTMEKYGFRALETEWWHYSWPNTNNFKVLDIDFKKLKE